MSWDSFQEQNQNLFLGIPEFHHFIIKWLPFLLVRIQKLVKSTFFVEAYNEAYDDNHYFTDAHRFYWRRHTNLQHVNTIVPLMKHTEMCQKIRKYAMPMIVNSKLSDSYKRFNMIYPKIFADIESNGMQINDSFKMKELITDGRVYSNYHYHTTTGRPSNAFRGFNFAAMNKQDGTRDAFCSRFEN